MATLPTPEESARAILSIFQAHGCRSGEALMAGAVNTQFLTGTKGRSEDYVAGLQYAGEHGWLEEGPNSLKLTDAGFAAM